MRIAIYYNLPSGGGKHALHEWTCRLAKRHQIDVYTLSSADHTFRDIRPFVEKYRIFDFSPRPLFDSPFGRLNQWQRWRDLSSLTRTGAQVAQEINAHSYDVVFAHPCIVTYIPAFIHQLRVPTVYYLHEPFGRNLVRPANRPYLKKNPWRTRLDRLDPLIYLYQDRLQKIRVKNLLKLTLLLANSQYTQQCIQDAYHLPSTICHYGVNNQVFQPLHEIEKVNAVISVGQLTPRKGFDFLVESLGCMPVEKRPVLKLVCNVSRSPEDQYIHEMEKQYIGEMASRLGVNLQILTNLNPEQLAVEYNRARLCVYTPVLEPFGLVPLEAMACGTPVIGVREGGVQESILHEKTGLLVDRVPEKFAGAIQALLEDPGLSEQFGQQGREYVMENWTWDRSVAMLEEHLDSCVWHERPERGPQTANREGGF
jgi:glycosyltransferase involved in cell wall biosynthesis